jgi:hypothetical protein
MKHIFILLTMLSLGTSCKQAKNLSDCEILNLIFNDLKQNYHEDVVFVNSLMKIASPVIKDYLLTDFKEANHYDFSNYFKSETELIDCSFQFNAIKYSDLQDEIVAFEWSNLKSDANVVKYLHVYKPVFNKDKTEFLLYYEVIYDDMTSVSHLNLFSFKEGKIELKKELLIST